MFITSYEINLYVGTFEIRFHAKAAKTIRKERKKIFSAVFACLLLCVLSVNLTL